MDALAPTQPSMKLNWLVEFGDVCRPLQDIHTDTGLPKLIEPVQDRITRGLEGRCDGLTIIFRVDARRGLMHAFRGPKRLVKAALAALAGTGR